MRRRDVVRPLLVLQCEVLADSVPSAAAEIGEMDEMFRRALGGGGSVVISRICRGDEPPPPEDVAGVVITGSGAMVSDAKPWITRTRTWLQKAYASDMPMLGVCFGHQLLAHALGARVAPMPGGPQYSTTTVRLTDEAREDPLFHALPREFPASSAHYQVVIEPPAGSVVLARGSCGIQALRFGRAAWGVQFHPEFGVRDLRILIQALRLRLAEDGCDVETSLGALQETPDARSVLPRFRALATKPPH